MSSPTDDPVAILYEKYNNLLEAKDPTALAADFKYAIERTKYTDQEKKLSAQIISKFIKHFPDLQLDAINALIDLCEDSVDIIRISTIKHLSTICKDAPELVPRLVDILAQLVGLSSGKDHNLTSSCLLQVFKENPVPTVKSILRQINIFNDDNDRVKIIQFLYKTVLKVEEKITPEILELMIEGGKKLLEDSTQDEFQIVITFLTSSKLGKTVAGQHELVNLVLERAEIDRKFDLYENYSCDRIIACIDPILPLFNSQVSSKKLVVFYITQILPKLEEMAQLKHGDDYQYQFIRQLAELSVHCGPLDNAEELVKQLYETLKIYMPLPPADGNMDELPNLDFTAVELLLFTFHRLARQCPDFLTGSADLLKEFKQRLTYFSRGVGGCKRSIELAEPSDIKSDEKLKIAPLLLNNISTLIKDLFHSPPVYKCNITLAWRENNKKANASESATPQKRHAPVCFDESNSGKNPRMAKGGPDKGIYAPPNGKFSSNFQNYDRFGNRGRGRGNLRTWSHRGAGRSWRN